MKPPKDWRVVRFGDVTRIANGQVSPTEEPYVDLPHVGPENIESETGRVVDVKTARELGLISGKYEFDETAIVYSKIRPNLNKVCRPGFRGICSADAYPIWADEAGMRTGFLLYAMQSPSFVRQATACSMRSGLPKINREELSDLEFWSPPVSEQAVIEETLSAWETAIRVATERTQAEGLRKRGLMQQLLTGRKRFKEFKGERWRSVRLADVAAESTLRNRGKLDRSALMAVTKADGIVPMRKKVQGVSVVRCKTVKTGWFAYNPMRLNIGSIARWTGDREVMVSGDYVVFHCNENRIDHRWLDQFRRTHRWTDFVQGAGNGSVRIRIWFSDLGHLKFELPPLDEQRRIISVLETCDREIDLLQKQLNALKEQKRGMMQKLLTGEMRVKVESEQMKRKESR